MAWHNESRRHSLASRGIPTKQRIQILSRLNKTPPKKRNLAFVRKLREKILRELYANRVKGLLGNPEIFNPAFMQFSEKDAHYVPGDIFWKLANRVEPESMTLSTYRKAVAPNVSKDRLKEIIYSKDPEVQKEVRELDLDILQFMARNQGFKYKFVKDRAGEESLITYDEQFKKENPMLFKQLVEKVKSK